MTGPRSLKVRGRQVPFGGLADSSDLFAYHFPDLAAAAGLASVASGRSIPRCESNHSS